MPIDERLTLANLRDLVRPLFQLLEAPEPGLITYHLAVAKQMDALLELWGDRYTPPTGTSPEAYKELVGRTVPTAPNQEHKVMRIDDEIILINDDETIVMSRSDAGKRYLVTIATCQCTGYQFRGKCRHISAATAARSEYRKQAYEAAKARTTSQQQ